MSTDRIAHLYDDPGPFGSAYIDVSQDTEDAPHLAELQVRAACEAAADAGAPDSVVERLRACLAEMPHGPAPLSRFVVATQSGVLLNEVVHSRREQPQGTWSPLPDVATWLADEQITVPFVLALVDHEGGDVQLHRAGVETASTESTAGGETDFGHKVRGGGWAHLKWQHYAENVWERNADSVADEVLRHVRDGVQLVLIAGDARSRSLVRDTLGTAAADATIVELDAGSRHADGGDQALRAAVGTAVEEAVATLRLAQGDELHERLGRDDAVATGVADLLDAFVRGQVDRLLIDPDEASELEVRPADHPGLAFGAISPMPDTVRADTALVAAAALTGASITVISSRLLSGAPAAGLLRWDQPSEGARA